MVDTGLQLSVDFGLALTVPWYVQIIGVITMSLGSLGKRVKRVRGSHSAIGARAGEGNAHNVDVVTCKLVKRARLEANAIRFLIIRALKRQACNHFVLI